MLCLLLMFTPLGEAMRMAIADRRERMTRWSQAIVLFLLVVQCPLVAFGATPIAPSTDGYDARVRPFFKAHCIKCHGPDKSKGELTLHTLDGDLALGRGLERWEDVLDALKFGEMPPEGRSEERRVGKECRSRWSPYH